MVRFKNRYLLVQLAFKDGKIDETISELTFYTKVRAQSLPWSPLIVPIVKQRSSLGAPPHTPPLNLPSFSTSQLAAEQIVLGDIRKSIQQNFGDHALGSALVSLFGKNMSRENSSRTPLPPASSSSHLASLPTSIILLLQCS
jgi:hypothetical protein